VKGVTAHAPVGGGHAAATHAPFTIDPYAFGAFACCVALLAWWVWIQCASRCTDCGYCPVWCSCDG
jgi:hypothetical protein